MAASSGAGQKTGEIERRNHELAILNAIAQALNRSVDLEGALQAALAQAAELFGLQTGWVWLLAEGAGDGGAEDGGAEDSGEHYLAAAQNLPSGLIQHPELMAGSCYCLDTYRAGDLAGAANVNVITCSRLKKLVAGTDGLRYHASIPLYAPQGRQLGVLNLASADWRELSPEDLRLLYTVGDLLSIAIERARLFARRAEFGATEERNRLAREIHDTLAQGLAGIALQLETADLLLEAGADPERARSAVQGALALARANLEEARRSVLDLRAAPLEGRSLAQALAELAEEHTSAGRQVAFESVGGPRPLAARLEVGLYRIAQEALANAIRHAGATRITLRLAALPEAVVLTVADDGRGFDPAQIPPGRFGLIGLNERARLLGGRLEVRSTHDQGTTISISVKPEHESANLR